MSDFATEIGIIDATGQIPGVRVQGSYTACRTVSTCACILQLADSLVHVYMLSQEHNRQAPRLTQHIAVHAEEWNSIAESGPDFYTAHLMPPEPQPSLASMQQGEATSCSNIVHPQQLKPLLADQRFPTLVSNAVSLHAALHSNHDLQLSWQHNHNLPAQHQIYCVPQSFHM